MPRLQCFDRKLIIDHNVAFTVFGLEAHWKRHHRPQCHVYGVLLGSSLEASSIDPNVTFGSSLEASFIDHNVTFTVFC